MGCTESIVEYNVKEITIQDKMNINNGLDAGVYLGIVPSGYPMLKFEFRLVKTDNYAPEKFREMRDLLEDLVGIAKRPTNG